MIWRVGVESTRDGLRVAYTYNTKFPPNCPPKDAVPANSDVFSSIKKLPIKSDHFLSDVERKKKGSDPCKCDDWGCSIWTTEESALLGRAIIPGFKKYYIVRATLSSADGEMLATPSQGQEGHYTFWKVAGLDLSPKFSVYLEPDTGED